MAFGTAQCSFCNKTFLKDNRHINENRKLGHNFYCSLKCQYSFKNKQKILICENTVCKNKFKRSPKHIYFHNFCSRKCYATLVSLNNKLRSKSNFCNSCGKKIASAHKYCSPSCWGYDHQISKEKLISNLRILYKKLGRTPTRREFKSFTACVSCFGSWNNAVLAAGLIPNRSLNQRMYKRRKCISIDGHLCDSVSELLIDNWLYKNKINHQKSTPYPKGKFVADWSLSSNILIEYFGLANDSRRYDEEIKKKQAICRETRITLIEIYSQDLFPEIKLEEILKSNSLHDL